MLTVIPDSDISSSMIFAKRQASSLNYPEIESKIFYLPERTSLRGLFKSFIKFKELLKQFQPDIIHSQYGTITSFFCAFTNHKKLIITFHGSDLNKTPSDGIMRDLVGRIFSQVSTLRASKIVCVSSSLKGCLWWNRNKATVLPVGVNTEKFIAFSQTESREKIGWKKESKIILFNGNAPIVKRIDIADEVYFLVKKEIPKCELVVLKGDIDPEQMPLYLSASDCLLLCSDSEGSPMMVKEALACNLPIVGIEVGDVSERIAGVKNCVITKRNYKLLSEEVIKLLNKNERSDGREKLIADGLSEKKVSERLLQIYLEVLNK
ncbi:MAG: glycosyltransferase [Bacteroidia bacterium]